MVVPCLWRVADTWRLSVWMPVLIQFFLLTRYSRVVKYVSLTDPFIYLGFLKICIGANLDKGGDNRNLTFSRRYLDPNRITYEVTHFQLWKSEGILNVLNSFIPRRMITRSILGPVNSSPRDWMIWPPNSTCLSSSEPHRMISLFLGNFGTTWLLKMVLTDEKGTVSIKRFTSDLVYSEGEVDCGESWSKNWLLNWNTGCSPCACYQQYTCFYSKYHNYELWLAAFRRICRTIHQEWSIDSSSICRLFLVHSQCYVLRRQSGFTCS